MPTYVSVVVFCVSLFPLGRGCHGVFVEYPDGHGHRVARFREFGYFRQAA